MHKILERCGGDISSLGTLAGRTVTVRAIEQNKAKLLIQ
uniref:Uncharacterized protein n=1 Tax=Arundo donax TaxID=35708 RepID=A0A0A9GXA7_ARUDO